MKVEIFHELPAAGFLESEEKQMNPNHISKSPCFNRCAALNANLSTIDNIL